jgi:hypothetical protein
MPEQGDAAMRMTWKSMAAQGSCAWCLAWALLAATAEAQEPIPLAPPEVPPPVAGEADNPAAPCPEKGTGQTKSANSSASKSSGSTSGGRMADPAEVRRERRRAWIFNRYAGSIEMQDKTPYPYGYYGDYYFRGWKPDWVYPLPPPPLRFEEPPVIRHPEGMPVLPGMEGPGGDQPPVPAAAKARTKTKRG